MHLVCVTGLSGLPKIKKAKFDHNQFQKSPNKGIFEEKAKIYQTNFAIS
jgi:hypothetical protein